MRALGAAVALLSCACGGKKSPPRFEGELPIAFGDCSDLSTQFVSGPLPLPFGPGDFTRHASVDDPPPPPEEDKPDTGKDESGGTGTAMALDEGKMGKKDSDRAEGQYKMKKVELADASPFGGYVNAPIEEEHIGLGGNYGPIPGRGAGNNYGYGGLGHRDPSAPAVTIGQPNVEGDLDKAIIRRYIKRNIQKLQYCYEKQLPSKPRLAGTLKTEFFITPSGDVTSAKADGIDPEVAKCVADAIRGIQFPKPKGGGGVKVIYPFTFRPGDAPARGSAAAPAPEPPPPPPHPVEKRPTSATIDPQPLARLLFRPAKALPHGRQRYQPGGTNPLHYARDQIEECLRGNPEHSGSIVVERQGETITVHGIADEPTRACITSAITSAKLDGLDKARCPLAFGATPVDRQPGIDVGEMVSFLNKPFAVDALQKQVRDYRAAAVADGAPVVAIHGPLVLRVRDDTPMPVVLLVTSAILSADEDFALAVKRGDAWQLLDNIAAPMPPMPLGAGGRWSRLKTKYAPPGPDQGERVNVSVLVGKDRAWVSLSRVGVTDELPRDKVLAKLEEHRNSAFFGPERFDIEIAATADARYADFVAVVDAAVKVGFSDWQLTDEAGLVAPPRR